MWEGVTQYLWEEAIHQTLAFVGTSAPGSLLLFTYVLKSIIDHCSDVPGAENLMKLMAKRKTPWLFGLDSSSLSSFLQPFHLALVTDVGNADYQARYLKLLGRNLVVSEGERIVQATVFRR